jgi:cysteine-rich repeat protein
MKRCLFVLVVSASAYAHPVVCGDGVVTGDETCDDGGVIAGDGCSASCWVELGWACSVVPTVCFTSCGDGVRAGAEMCDDGDRRAGDGCSPTCYFEPAPDGDGGPDADADGDGVPDHLQSAPVDEATADGFGCAHGRRERSPLGSVVLGAAAMLFLARRREG